MSSWIVYSIGFLAQILFSGRLIIQWILSEKSKRIITPSAFWKLSLFASFLLFVYGYLRDDFAIMLGQALTYYIYIRNLQLQGEWQKAPKWLRVFLFIFPILIVIYAYNNGEYDIDKLFRNDAAVAFAFGHCVTNTFYFAVCVPMDRFRKNKNLAVARWFLAHERFGRFPYFNLRNF